MGRNFFVCSKSSNPKYALHTTVVDGNLAYVAVSFLLIQGIIMKASNECYVPGVSTCILVFGAR